LNIRPRAELVMRAQRGNPVNVAAVVESSLQFSNEIAANA
jgi:hypothetical protein